MSGGNYYDPIRDYVDKNRPAGISQAYDAAYKGGKMVGNAVDRGIREVEKVSPGAGAVARSARSYAEDNLPMFQDNRPHRKK